MSDTPRTDGQNPITPSEVDDVWIYNAPMVNADFARQLERELAAAAIELRTLRTANAGLAERVTETQAALDLSARQLLETVNDRNSIGVQLDLLRDELMRIRSRIGETGLIGEHPQLSSIALYCERAQHDIAVRYTPIQERDRLEREVLKLVKKVKRLEDAGDGLRKASRVFLLSFVDDDYYDDEGTPIRQVDPDASVQWEDPPTADDHVQLQNAIDKWNQAVAAARACADKAGKPVVSTVSTGTAGDTLRMMRAEYNALDRWLSAYRHLVAVNERAKDDLELAISKLEREAKP